MADRSPFPISGHGLTLARVAEIIAGNANISLAPETAERVAASRAVVEHVQSSDRPLYGINTGFGILANQRIASADTEKLQENLILSHAVGVGDEVPREIVHLMLLLKINALAIGLSGVSLELIEYLIRFFNARVTPVIFTKGSLGASGDLAPLAHLTLALLGREEVWLEARRMTAQEALAHLGLAPLKLRSKEGLALINGTQFMLAYAVHCLFRIIDLLKTADLAATMTLEALRGSASPFHAGLHEARPHRGQIQTAENLRQLLADSQILPSHADCRRVQDPYSLRCVPQVHGAVREAARHAQQIVETEMNSVTDNPLVFPDGEVVSGGNFHGEMLALVLDYLAIATAELASISERRLYLLLGGDTMPDDKKVPTFLMRDTGLNSGFMVPQYTAAALVSENKVLAHPASVDSIPSSLGQEDHVSMGATSATKLLEIVKNTETVVAIELMSSAQALDFIHPLLAGKGVEAAHREIRKKISFADMDRIFFHDIAAALALVRSRDLILAAEEAVGVLHGI